MHFENSGWALRTGVKLSCVVAILVPHLRATPFPEPQSGSASEQSSVEKRIDAVFAEQFASGARRGALCVGVVHHGEVTLRFFGRVTEGSERVPDLDTEYEIGSLTKLFTATLLAMDVDAGRAALDQPVSDVLGEAWSVPSKSDRRITLLDLATHTSALPRMPRNIRPKNRLDPYADYSVDLLRDELSNLELRWPIGERYVYSNLGYGLLGHALATASQTSLGERYATDITKPLGMSATHVSRSPRNAEGDEQANIAQPHFPNGVRAHPWNFDVLAGAGAIRSTLGDMMRFARAQLDPPKTRLGRAMRSTQEPRHQIKNASWVGLGWHMLRKDDRVSSLEHSGRTGGYASEILILPAHDLAVVILAGQASGAMTEARRLATECSLEDRK
ncbi:MAG: beta-lactamase family protein [Planctomycetes bacterium]|nr:beta-lactamase family protein [Planctomycetota bacterium]